MKKVLFVASVGQFLGFERNDIKILQSLGYEVHIAANLSLSEIDDFHADGVIRHQIDFARIPWSKTNLKAYKQLKRLFEKTHFDIVHCHTPMGGVLARLTAKKYRKAGTKVIYTAHGFHFYKGAPLKNWLLYFPVEWILSFFTDVLITINKEDFALAKKHMHAQKTKYVSGVGIDVNKFSPDILTSEEKLTLRRSLGIKDNEKMILSVGELIPRKNHETAIRAIHKLNDKRIKYFICGQGALQDRLQSLINDLGISNNVKLLGFRTDISKLCCCADMFVFPSLQEGLPVALMEAMASGLPCVVSDIRGNTDLIDDGKGGFLCNPNDVDGFAKKIKMLLSDKDLSTSMSIYNINKLKKFDISAINSQMKRIYQKAIKN